MAQEIKSKFKIQNSKIFIKILFVDFSLFFLFVTNSFAASSYVLPYPSAMPGSIFYKISLVKEVVMKYWYFGDFGQFTYSLKESDKYLVEAKTLFEYNQYLLGYKALQKSNAYFQNTLPNLNKARTDGKNIQEKLAVLQSASLRHQEVLTALSKEIPKEFYWNPEKGSPQNLPLLQLVSQSILLRNNYYEKSRI